MGASAVPKRVLVVDHSAQLGGAEFSLEALIAHLAAGKYGVTVALPGPGPFADRLRAGGFDVRLIRLESWRWWITSLRYAARFVITGPLQVISVIRWLRVLRAMRPAVVHLNINRIIEPLIAAKLLRIPVIVHFRDIPSRMRHRFVLGWRGFYLLMRMADVWIANSAATASDIASHGERPPLVIPNGLDLAAFDAARARGRDQAKALLSRSAFHVAMIGGINPWKRQADFVQMALRLLQRRRDTTFYVVGLRVNETYARQLEDAIRNAGAEARVLLLGEIDCVPAFLDQIDLVAHTMPDESFGRVFLEAMAACCPVVAYRGGGAAELIAHGKTGLLVDIGDVETLAEAAASLLDDAARREQLGAAGRVLVETSYSIGSHVTAVAGVYDALMTGHA